MLVELRVLRLDVKTCDNMIYCWCTHSECMGVVACLSFMSSSMASCSLDCSPVLRPVSVCLLRLTNLPLSSLLLTDPETHVATDQTRKLGRVVVRGTQISLMAPQDGVEEIANPFVADGDEED